MEGRIDKKKKLTEEHDILSVKPQGEVPEITNSMQAAQLLQLLLNANFKWNVDNITLPNVHTFEAFRTRLPNGFWSEKLTQHFDKTEEKNCGQPRLMSTLHN